MSRYYAVAFGHKSGVYESYEEMKKMTKGFTHSVHKRFDTREDAEKFVHSCKPLSVSMDVDQSGNKFFAVARGKEVGIFDDYDKVKKSFSGYPSEAKLYKKFNSYPEAKEFIDKFSKIETENFNPDKEAETPVKLEKVRPQKAATTSPSKSHSRKRTQGEMDNENKGVHDRTTQKTDLSSSQDQPENDDSHAMETASTENTIKSPEKNQPDSQPHDMETAPVPEKVVNQRPSLPEIPINEEDKIMGSKDEEQAADATEIADNKDISISSIDQPESECIQDEAVEVPVEETEKQTEEVTTKVANISTEESGTSLNNNGGKLEEPQGIARDETEELATDETMTKKPRLEE